MAFLPFPTAFHPAPTPPPRAPGNQPGPPPELDLEPLIDRIPEPWRLPLALHYLHGQEELEIARTLDLTPRKVRSRLRKGLKRLGCLCRTNRLTDLHPHSLPRSALQGTLLEPPPGLGAQTVFAHAVREARQCPSPATVRDLLGRSLPSSAWKRFTQRVRFDLGRLVASLNATLL